jgi:hypothetical protein
MKNKDTIELPEERPISYTTAKYLNTANFPKLPKQMSYMGEGEDEGALGFNVDCNVHYEAPTQTQLQKWFREKYFIDVRCELFQFGPNELKYYAKITYHHNGVGRTMVHHIDTDGKAKFLPFDLGLGIKVDESYEECLESALFFAIIIVKKLYNAGK